MATLVSAEIPERIAQEAGADPSASVHPRGAADQIPLVSVIIPCYNGEAYLRETIQSALAQSHSRVEILVIDDGSTDRSGEIAQALPVRYIRQQNCGLTPSRNRGVRESRGSFIVFLDADDRLKPDAIEAGLRVLKAHPECAMTIGDHLFIASDGSFLNASRKTCLASAHYEALLKSNFIEMISSVLFRKDVLQAVGGFDTSLRVAEDYELYLRIARAYPVCCHPAVIAEYRLHKNNASHNSELMLTMTLDVLKTQVPYIRGNPGRLLAFLEGLRTWRKQYGRQLAWELARSGSSLPIRRFGRKLYVLLSYYPQGVLQWMMLRTLPNLSPKLNRRKRIQNADGWRTTSLSKKLPAASTPQPLPPVSSSHAR